MTGSLRKSGIEVLGDIPWGTHFCQFYETPQDLLYTEAAFFKAGLQHNEYCLWILSETNKELTVEEAASTLRKLLPDLDDYLAADKLEIVSREEWFLKEGIYDLKAIAERFSEKLKQALLRGFDGMRVNGGGAWLLDHFEGELHKLEKKIDQFIVGQPLIILCNFPLPHILGNDMFDVMHNHQFGIARRYGKWEVFETPELLQAKASLKKMNEDLEQLNNKLEQRVAERTQQLDEAVQYLKIEITDHKKAEELLTESYQQIRALTEHLQNIREEEQIRIARELHDEIGQQLTVLKLNADWLREEIDSPDKTIQKKFKDHMAMVDTAIQSVRKISTELRPSALDDMGLAAAMDWHLNEFEKRTNIQSYFLKSEKQPELSAKVQTAFFRIFQEALTNVARHARASEVKVTLTQKNSHLHLSIHDNGAGFDPQKAKEKRTLGLLGMKERAAMIGANYQVQSKSGEGTTVSVLLPIHE
ncbi:MEDS domain-containing protein [Flavisolibacter tropicus]|uniref:MEDS domain-containing protein n=1 Tax=Flavisolibacter tropicus TaxID=1492898 RepID=UPI000835514F|nr:MEDS domain-containing protein [Flavisolibacter tropicus]